MSSLSSFGDNLLRDFILEVCLYFDLEKNQCIRKYVSRNHGSGNFIFPIKIFKDISKWDGFLKNSFEDKFAIEDVRIKPELGICQVFLNNNSAAEMSLQSVCLYGETYGVNSLCDPKLELVNATKTFLEDDLLSAYRLHLSNTVIQRLSHVLDSLANKDSKLKRILICDHRTKPQNLSSVSNVVCRTEVNDLNGEKNVSVSCKDYKMLREKDIRNFEGERYNDEGKMICIVNSCLVFDLLATRLNMPVYLNFSDSPIMFRNPSSKGAIFVLYTYARMASVIQKFESFMKENNLKEPSISETDFSALNSKDEKEIIFNYILMFPVLMEEIWVDLINKNEFMFHKLCLFLSQFSSAISKYYRFCRVLMTQTPKLHPLMFARIHLFRACLQVLKNGLFFLSIEPLSTM